MVNIETSHRVGLNSGTVNYDMTEFENGVLMHSVSRTLTHAHGRTAQNQIGKSTIKLICTVNSISGEIRVEVAFLIHGIVVSRDFILVTTTGTFIVELTHNGSGLPNGQPTYLEELSKLDQYSKAQYIPDERQRLLP